LPPANIDTTASQHFSRPFSIEWIDAVKDRILRDCRGAVRHLDGVGYDDILIIPSQQVADLFHLLPKSITHLIDRRLREWVATTGCPPDSQSGSRPDHSDNYAFVLPNAIKTARAPGRTLYVLHGPPVDRPMPT
ncbi:hypothetical protein BV20DRAFT_949926, partial [Pilatotrama ljubarskyi]